LAKHSAVTHRRCSAGACWAKMADFASKASSFFDQLLEAHERAIASQTAQLRAELQEVRQKLTSFAPGNPAPQLPCTVPDPDSQAAGLSSLEVRRSTISSIHEAPATLKPRELEDSVCADSDVQSEPDVQSAESPQLDTAGGGTPKRSRSVEVHAAWLRKRQLRKGPRNGRRKSYQGLDKAGSVLPTTPNSMVSAGSWLSLASDPDNSTGFGRASREVSIFLRRCVSRPGSARRLCWDVIGMFFMIYDLIVIPLDAFDPEEIWFTYIMQWTTKLYWTLDVPMSVFAGFYSSSGIVEMRIRKIAVHYARTWFPFDICVLFLDWGISVVSSSLASGSSAYLRVGRSLRFLRVLRLLRLLKLQAIIAEILDRISSEASLILIGILQLIIFIMLLNHCIACIWYALGDTNDIRSWTIENNLPGETLGYRYCTALHWSLTQFTPASMEVVPENTAERAFAVSVLIFAMVTFSSFVSSITNAMTRLRNLNSERADRHQKLRQYLSENQVSTEVMARIWSCLNQLLRSSKTRLHQKDVRYVAMLPRSLQADLLEEVYSPVVLRHPLFLKFALEDNIGIRTLFYSAFSELSINESHELFSPHIEVQEAMHFMLLGTSVYRLEDVEGEETRAPSTVQAPDWVCEAALWVTWTHVGTLTASSHCEFISMQAPKAQEIMGGLAPVREYVCSFARYYHAHREDITDIWSCKELQSEWAEAAFNSGTPQESPQANDDRPTKSDKSDPFAKSAGFFKSLSKGMSRTSILSGGKQGQ